VGVSRERGNLKLHDAAASRISATVVDGEETALAVVDEPASASSRTNEPPRLLEGRELAAIRPTKRLVAPAGGSGTANDELSDINRVLGRVAGLVEQLHEDRVAVEVGGGVLPLREGDRGKVLHRPIQEGGDPDHRRIGGGLVKHQAKPRGT